MLKASNKYGHSNIWWFTDDSEVLQGDCTTRVKDQFDEKYICPWMFSKLSKWPRLKWACSFPWRQPSQKRGLEKQRWQCEPNPEALACPCFPRFKGSKSNTPLFRGHLASTKLIKRGEIQFSDKPGILKLQRERMENELFWLGGPAVELWVSACLSAFYI